MAQERRKAVRSYAAAGSRGRLRSTVEVEILDVSPGGLRLELATSLRPGAVYDIQSDLSGHQLSAQIRITRCAAGGYRDDGKGGRLLLFRAGAEFIWASDEPRLALEKYLEQTGDRPAGQSGSGFLRILP